MLGNAMMIALAEAKEAARGEVTLEGRIKAAMGATVNHWCATDEDERFRAAVGAAMLLSDEAEKERVQAELGQLRLLSAMLSGVPVDFERVEPLENPLRLVDMWAEVKAAKEGEK